MKLPVVAALVVSVAIKQMQVFSSLPFSAAANLSQAKKAENPSATSPGFAKLSSLPE